MKPVVLDRGLLVDAMMASMSVPGVLPPYKLGNQLLVDGGVTDNMPVDVAREMGADHIIAVDISTDYKTEQDFTNVWAVADQLSNYLVRQSTQRAAETLTAKDIYLKPDIGDMDTADFDLMEHAYQKGYQAVMAQRSQFAKFALSPAEYRQYQLQKQQHLKAFQHPEQWVFDRVELDNHSHYSDDVLKQLLDISPGQKMTREEIEARIDTLYAQDRFERIQYRIEKRKKQQVLVVSVQEKSWGPNYVNFHFGLEDDFHTQSQYSLGVSVNFTDLDSKGSELRLDMETGSDRKVYAQLYSPLTDDQKLFSTASLSYTKYERNIPQKGFKDTSLSATKDYVPVYYQEFSGELALGYQYRLWDEFTLGIRASDGKAGLSTIESAGTADYDRLGFFGRYRLDSLDSYSLPNSGYFLNLDYLLSHDRVASEAGGLTDSYDETVYEYSLRAIGATSFGRHTLVANAEYSAVKSKQSIAPIVPRAIGGLLHLSGIPRNSLIGENEAFTSLVYRYRWFDNDFGLFTSPVYLGASIEYGGVWSDKSIHLNNAPLYVAGSVFAGIDSPVGPVMLGYGRTEQDYDSYYLSVGYVF
jgi:NTE family protein